MSPPTITVLLTSFPGLGLPPTLALPVSASTAISDVRAQLLARIPDTQSRLILTTNANKELSAASRLAVSSLLESQHDSILPLRLSAPLCGGKGGFGSQLRAAGGRMSSKRKRNQGENNGSNRNLDGRRLRTVTEAKALAEYLALKPEMDKRQKEARRKRWEEVVTLAEKREEELKSGAKGRVDGKWVEEKEEAGERTREAVRAAMKAGDYKDNLLGTSSGSAKSAFQDANSPMDEDDVEATSSATTSSGADPSNKAVTYFGFDDEFMSDDEEETDEEEEEEEDGKKEEDGEEKEKANHEAEEDTKQQEMKDEQIQEAHTTNSLSLTEVITTKRSSALQKGKSKMIA